MVWAISEGESVHDPGAVTDGLLKDLGWTIGTTTSICYVDPSASCGGNTPCYDTIQASINAASTGSTIKIVQGTYVEDLTLSSSKEVTLSGGWNSSYTTQSSSSSVSSLKRSKGTLIVKRVSIQR